MFRDTRGSDDCVTHVRDADDMTLASNSSRTLVPSIPSSASLPSENSSGSRLEPRISGKARDTRSPNSVHAKATAPTLCVISKSRDELLLDAKTADVAADPSSSASGECVAGSSPPRASASTLMSSSSAAGGVRMYRDVVALALSVMSLTSPMGNHIRYLQ